MNKSSEILLCLDHVSKSFPGVRALNDISFTIAAGTVHGLIGENGAGKSTLMKILSGSLLVDEGTISFEGNSITLHSVAEAQNLGISIVYQELSLLNNLTVAQNLFVMDEPTTSLGLIDDSQMLKDATSLLQGFGIDIDPSLSVSSLSMTQKQLVEIAKVVRKQQKLIILDEPTSSLDESEVQTLFQIIHTLKSRGTTFIYISHKMKEIFSICDYISVLRDGLHIRTAAISEVTERELIPLMVGRQLQNVFPVRTGKPSNEVLLSCRAISSLVYHNITFDLYKGEILGLYGLIGAGRTEIAKGLFGLIPHQSGEILIHDQPVRIQSPQDAISNGLAFISENRKEEGLVVPFSVIRNISMANLLKILQRHFIQQKLENALASDYISQLNIKVSDPRQAVGSLSGGNQQKVVLAKWFATKPDIIILDEPTRGIDINAKSQVYKIIAEMARRGAAILFISSELPEILNLSDRILLVKDQQIHYEFQHTNHLSETDVIEKLFYEVS